jgi:predicted lipoprotein with Yx(FWY)xxD motif
VHLEREGITSSPASITADLGKGNTSMRVLRTRALLFAAPAVLVLAGAAACSSSGGSTASSSGSTAAVSAPSSAASSGSAGSSSSAALKVTTSSSLGAIVTTGSGLTVYRFDNDTASPSKSNCTGGCATAWPPVLATGSGTPQVSGVSSSLVGEITRADGTKQLTLAGWPLYTYAGDSGPGATSGQGSGGIWWAVTTTGAKASSSGAGAAASPSAMATTAAAGGGSGY